MVSLSTHTGTGGLCIASEAPARENACSGGVMHLREKDHMAEKHHRKKELKRKERVKRRKKFKSQKVEG